METEKRGMSCRWWKGERWGVDMMGRMKRKEEEGI